MDDFERGRMIYSMRVIEANAKEHMTGSEEDWRKVIAALDQVSDFGNHGDEEVMNEYLRIITELEARK